MFGSPVPMENPGMAVHTSELGSAGKAGTGGSRNLYANMVSWMSSTHPISEDKVMSYTVFDLQTAPTHAHRVRGIDFCPRGTSIL